MYINNNTFFNFIERVYKKKVEYMENSFSFFQFQEKIHNTYIYNIYI